MKYKIGILTEIINSHSGARAPLEIAKHLALLHHNVTVFAYRQYIDEKTIQDLESHGVTISLVSPPFSGLLGKYFNVFSMYTQLKQAKPSILIFSGTLPFFLAAKPTGIPIIRLYQGIQFDAFLERKNPDEHPSPLEHMTNALLNVPIFLIDCMSFKMSTGVVAISEFAKKEGERLYRRSVERVIYHGTTPLHHIKKSLQKRPHTLYLLSVSRLTPYKGFHLIIEALKKVKTNKKLVLTIAGSQPKNKYVRYLKKIGGNMLQLIVNPSDKQLAELYQQSDIYVSADTLLYFGMPVTEAALFGKPAVLMDFAAAPEVVVDGKTGLIAKTESQFAVCLEELIHNKKLRDSLGQNAKKRAQTIFTWKRVGREYLESIQKILQAN